MTHATTMHHYTKQLEQRQQRRKQLEQRQQRRTQPERTTATTNVTMTTTNTNQWPTTEDHDEREP